MGISGLLPLLKPIHKNKHLSEFSGKTIAVDAYVWLHKGVYACAPEVATGKKTIKYVEYSMHRVRLLRRHKITPYIVFDGGPLPAKGGTESERKKRRDENLAMANKLAAEGKHAQAREYYVKCVDVTTEMAYQFIKALRAEGVQYVVAPYEADAQLAYLERVGIVDAILTEDSDLLVFGCKNVLFKLDSVAATATLISRSDFGSVTAAEGGVSLVGWSDVQFRAMAILSGCDYLPSIPGVGLKTAWSLLRKYKTVEKVIRAIMLEGKKDVPPDYLSSFKLVEKVFLHQLVYDPRTERMVHLIELPDGEKLDEEARESVGRELEPSLAKRVAIGDFCPISLLPIVDINPAYVPRMLKPLPLLLNGGTPVTLEKAMMKQAPPTTTLHDFFQPKPKMQTPGPSTGRQGQPSAKKSTATAGQASGKRTLSEVLEMDADFKKRKRSNENNKPGEGTSVVTSRFFSPPRKTSPKDGQASGNPPGSMPVMVKQSGVVEMIDLTLDGDEPECHDIVQEDGYISPTRSSYRFETPEVSTPHRHSRMSKSGVGQEDDDDFDAELLSSPVEGRRHRGKASKRAHNVDLDRKYSDWTINGDDIDSGDDGPDLRGSFEDVDELPSDIDCPGPGSSFASTATTSSAGPITPNHSTSLGDVEDFWETEEDRTRTARTGAISDGWVKRWSYNGLEIKKTPVRRTETTVTGDRGRRASYQKRSEASNGMRSSGIRPIPKKKSGTELKGRAQG